MFEDEYSFRGVRAAAGFGLLTDVSGHRTGSLRSYFSNTSDPALLDFYGEGEIAGLSFTGKGQQELVDRVANMLSAAGLRVTTSIATGDARSIILEEAAKWQADMIVRGSHGRKGLERFFLGSVSEAVARHAHCSVQIVRISK